MPIEIQRPGAQQEERRRIRRSRLLMAGTVRERTRGAIEAKISDLSERGCRIECVGAPFAGTQIWVRVPGLESQSAIVIWSQGSNAGLQFSNPLHPAVARRFTGETMSEPVHHVMSGETPAIDLSSGDRMLSRREQIVQGVAANDHSPLTRRKKPKNGGLMSTIARQVVRTVDHRKTERFREFTASGEVNLQIGSHSARPLDLSSNGLRAAVDFEVEIGRTVPIVVEGFDPIPGRVVWARGSEVGFALPADSFDLQAS